MQKVDDYELYDKDYAEFIRRGMESFGLEIDDDEDRLNNLKK